MNLSNAFMQLSAASTTTNFVNTESAQYVGHMADNVFYLAIAALIVAVILVKYTNYNWTPYSVIRLIGLILILIITMYIIVAPIEKDTVTQVVGLLGALGGYLLGKDPREMDINQVEKPKPDDEKSTPSLRESENKASDDTKLKKEP